MTAGPAPTPPATPPAAGPAPAPRAAPATGPTDPPGHAPADAASAGGSVWANREFVALWAAFTWSLAGDQLARVALAVLLYEATGSVLWAAAGGAVTLLAPVLGGPLLGGLADRFPRRRVMIVCDLGSAVLVAAIALPGLPLLAMIELLLLASLLSAPFGSARAAVSRDVFADNRQYAAAMAVMALTARTAIAAGLLGGGAVVAVFGARPALLLDAATFAASALLVRLWVTARPAARQPGAPVVSGFRVIFADPVLRTAAGYGWLAAFYIAPAAVIVPYAASHGGGPAMVGALLAVEGAAAGLAMWVLTTRVRPEAQTRWLVPGGVLACAPLILLAGDPGVPAFAALTALSSVGASYQVVANTLFQTVVANDHRGAAFGAVSAVLLGGQGAGMLAVAGLAGPLGITNAVAVFGAAGTVAALALAPAGRGCAAPAPLRQA